MDALPPPKKGIPMNYVCNGSFQDFVCLDFETTGLSGTKDKVTEIGAVKVQGGDVVQRFSTLVNPGRPIPPRVVALTGILRVADWLLVFSIPVIA